MSVPRRAAVALAFLAACVVDIGRGPSAQAPKGRPLLVTVDDLPVAGRAASGDAAARRATTDALLAVLRKHRIPAVAFVIAGNVKTPDDEALLQRWLDAGHELGSHSRTHPSYTALTTDGVPRRPRRRPHDPDRLPRAAGQDAALLPLPVPARRRHAGEGDGGARRRSRRPASATCRSPSTTQDWSFDTPWAAAVASGDAAAIDEVRQDYLAALRLAVTSAEAAADAQLGRPAPQVLLLHANAVGAANWDALFTWLAAHGHRFASADEVLADATFRDPPIDAARSGYGHYARLAKVQRAAEARQEIAALLETQAAAWNRGDLEAFCAVYAEQASFASPSGLTRGRERCWPATGRAIRTPPPAARCRSRSWRPSSPPASSCRRSATSSRAASMARRSWRAGRSPTPASRRRAA